MSKLRFKCEIVRVFGEEWGLVESDKKSKKKKISESEGCATSFRSLRAFRGGFMVGVFQL